MNAMPNIALSIVIEGKVQGKGVRPLISKIAKEYNLTGWVKNNGAGVAVFCQGKGNSLQQFIKTIQTSPSLKNDTEIFSVFNDEFDASIDCFSIISSASSNNPRHIPQDSAICNECLGELFDKNNRRYKYPFISCTQCGPRFSILKDFPIDRINSAYDDHQLCMDCQTEYENSEDRRYHAQNISCPGCGPSLSLVSQDITWTSNIISRCSKLLKEGKIIAIKSVSGYRLIANASNSKTINVLRQRKQRPSKPFAIMVKDSRAIQEICEVSDRDIKFLQSQTNPILLLPKKRNTDIAKNVAPNINQFGIHIPGTGLEHLLLKEFSGSIISTSANLSGQSIIYDEKIAAKKLEDIADAFIHHNLMIKNPCDDSVWQATKKKPQPIRLGRGFSPIELTLPYSLKKTVVALGAQDKTTLSLAWNNRLVISPHIGDMGDHSCWLSLQDKLQQLSRLYNVTPEHYIIDKHPTYTSNQWVKKEKYPHTEVLHHHAHASSLYLNMPQDKDALIFTWDGTGFGEKDQLWGGETFIGRPGYWKRIATFIPFPLPGGEKCIREIWRTAYSLLVSCDLEMPANNKQAIVTQILASQINAPLTSSVGRLFDGVTSLLGIMDETSFDGQAPIYLENLATYSSDDFIELSLITSEDKLYQIDYKPLIRTMVDTSQTIEYRSTVFHNSLARAILNCTQQIGENSHVENIGLSGGVFQNQQLSNKTQDLLEKHGYNVYTHDTIPCNDAGISAGQVLEYASRL